MVVGFRELEGKGFDEIGDIADTTRFDYYCWDLYATVTDWYTQDKARLKVRTATLHDIERGGKLLRALPTRDAMLPILGVLFSMVEKGVAMTALFERLPKRFSRAALLKKFPRPVSLRIVEQFSPADGKIKEVVFEKGGVTLLDEDRRTLPASGPLMQAMLGIGETLGRFFAPAAGFGTIARINYTDGVRIYFSNGDVAHVRPSGNADELRIYAVADTQARADAITKLGVAEPDGILRQLEKAVTA